jgi:hypothetical protein
MLQEVYNKEVRCRDAAHLQQMPLHSCQPGWSIRNTPGGITIQYRTNVPIGVHFTRVACARIARVEYNKIQYDTIQGLL